MDCTGLRHCVPCRTETTSQGFSSSPGSHKEEKKHIIHMYGIRPLCTTLMLTTSTAGNARPHRHTLTPNSIIFMRCYTPVTTNTGSQCSLIHTLSEKTAPCNRGITMPD